MMRFNKQQCGWVLKIRLLRFRKGQHISYTALGFRRVTLCTWNLSFKCSIADTCTQMNTSTEDTWKISMVVIVINCKPNNVCCLITYRYIIFIFSYILSIGSHMNNFVTQEKNGSHMNNFVTPEKNYKPCKMGFFYRKKKQVIYSSFLNAMCKCFPVRLTSLPLKYLLCITELASLSLL